MFICTCSPDNSYVSTNRQVSVTYTGGDWSGTLVRDVVSIGGSPQVEVELALITSSNKFFIPGAPWVGILGLAYESLAKVSLQSGLSSNSVLGLVAVHNKNVTSSYLKMLVCCY